MAGDFSPLNPMTLQDLIWVNVCQGIFKEKEAERDMQLFRHNVQMTEFLSLVLCDCRHILMSTDTYVRICALKGTKHGKLEQLDPKHLPSVTVPAEQKEQERRAKLTPEEREEEDFRAFMSGKQIRR